MSEYGTLWAIIVMKRMTTVLFAILLCLPCGGDEVAPLQKFAEEVIVPFDAAGRQTLLSKARELTAGKERLTAKEFEQFEAGLRRPRKFPPVEEKKDLLYRVPLPRLPQAEAGLAAGSKNVEFPLYVALPPGYTGAKPLPLLIVMHGGPIDAQEKAHLHAKSMLNGWRKAAGDRGWIAAATVEATKDISPIGPQIVTRIVEYLSERLNIDPDRLCMTGHSRGGFFSWGFGLREPDRYAGIAPDCGGLDLGDSLLNAAHLPVYNMQGKADNQGNQDFVLPRMARKNKERLDELRKQNPAMYDHLLNETDLPHTPNVALYDAALKWLGEKNRDCYPTTIKGHVGHLGTNRRLYWIQILDGPKAPIDAVCDRAKNEIRVTCKDLKKFRLFLHDRLVDLDKPVRVLTNGTLSHEGSVARSARFALEHILETGDPGRVFPATIDITVP